MKKYLGETLVEQKDTIFKDYTPSDWVIYFIGQYGGFDGSHHKDWVLDQVSRILKGTPIIIKLARWSDGQEEYRISTGEPTKEYYNWVLKLCDGEDGPDTYSYDTGVAP
jgi:hypothetical protein